MDMEAEIHLNTSYNISKYLKYLNRTLIIINKQTHNPSYRSYIIAQYLVQSSGAKDIFLEAKSNPTWKFC